MRPPTAILQGTVLGTPACLSLLFPKFSLLKMVAFVSCVSPVVILSTLDRSMETALSSAPGNGWQMLTPFSLSWKASLHYVSVSALCERPPSGVLSGPVIFSQESCFGNVI